MLESIARVASKSLVYMEMARAGELDPAITAWARDIISEAAASEGELGSFLNSVVGVAAAAMHSDSCGIFLTDVSRRTLTQRAGTGSQSPRTVIRSYPLPRLDQIKEKPTEKEKVGLTAWIAATGRSHYARNFADLSSHPHHRGQFDYWNFPGESKTECGAFLGVPLRVGGSIIGVIKVENITLKGQLDNRSFSPEAQRRFDLLSQDVALAITRLNEQRPFGVIQAAMPTIFEILRGGLDVSTLVKKLVSETASLLNARACALFLKEGDRLIQPPWAAVGWATRGPEVREYKLVSPDRIADNPTTDDERVGLTVWIAVREKKFTAHSNLELKMHPHHKGTFDKYNFDADEACESFIGEPLIAGGRLVGVLKAETKRTTERGVAEVTYFSEQDELVFDLIANSAAIAIENAKLAEAERLAEQIRNRPQRLLVALHEFVQEHLWAVDTLRQTAGTLRGRDPDSVSAPIVDDYAALLQSDFSIRVLETFTQRVTQLREFLEGSQGVARLYTAFAEALRVNTVPEIARLCSSTETTATLALVESSFFLAKSAGLLLDLFDKVGDCRRGDLGMTSRAALDEAREHLKEIRLRAAALARPESDIIARIIVLWQRIIDSEAPPFHPVRNPYVPGTPIRPPEPEEESSHISPPFFGRLDIYDWVAENLYGATQKNILVLHGEWRMGKTSILLQLEKGKLGKPLRERKDRPLYPVFVNLQSTPDRTERFLHRIAALTSECLQRHPIMRIDLPAPSGDDFDREPYGCFDQYMRRVDERLGTGLLVLMFDEFEALDRWVTEERVDAGVYGIVRDHMQFLRNIAFILAGSHQLNELSSDYQSLLRIALHREVGFMDEAAARDLVREPVRGLVVYEQGTVEELLRVTNRHPYLLQLLCHRLIGAMNQRGTTNHVSQDDIAAAINYIVGEGAPHLAYVWERLREMEQAVLGLLAGWDEAQAQPFDHASVVTHLGYSDAQVTVATQSLARRRLIEETASCRCERTAARLSTYHTLGVPVDQDTVSLARRAIVNGTHPWALSSDKLRMQCHK